MAQIIGRRGHINHSQSLALLIDGSPPPSLRYGYSCLGEHSLAPFNDAGSRRSQEEIYFGRCDDGLLVVRSRYAAGILANAHRLPKAVVFLDLLVPSLLVFFLGSAIGSFLNVVIYRLPAGLSVLYPPSRCPKCQTRLKPYDNVPVFGWLWLKGKCRTCRRPIAMRYPLVELVTSCLFVAVYLAFGPTWYTLGYWLFVSWLVALALIDLDTMTLPNVLTGSGLLLGWAFQAWVNATGAVEGTQSPLLMGAGGLISAVIASIVGLWIFDVIGILGSQAFGKTAMGGGDGKLAAMMAAWLGLPHLLLIIFLSALLGSVVGGGAIALGWLKSKQQIPFGPYLALAALLCLFYGDWLIQTYTQHFFPGSL